MEKSALKFICIFGFALISLSAKGQQFMKDADGRPLLERRYTDVQGSPYLNDQWRTGTVKLANGQTHKDVDLKYDQVAEELIFKNSEGKAFTFREPVKEFSLQSPGGSEIGGMIFRNGFKSTDAGTSNTFYQVLSDGETPLLKRSVKKVMENKPYGSATTIKTFHDVTTYYLAKNGQPVKVRKDKKAILAALGDYTANLEEFIRTNKLNFKSDNDLIMLVTFYNSLK